MGISHQYQRHTKFDTGVGVAKARKKEPTRIPEDVIARIVRKVEEAESDESAEARLQRAVENIHLYYDKVKPLLENAELPKTSEVVEMLVDSCLVERNLEEGLSYFLNEIKSRGLEIQYDAQKYRDWVEKLSRLRMFRKLIHSMGLGRFEDQMVEIEIKKCFAPGSLVTPEAGLGGTRGRK